MQHRTNIHGLGPNHKDNCDGKTARLSGSGYNRVRVCACGAEDPASEPGSFKVDEHLEDFLRKYYPEDLDEPLR